MNSIMRFIGVWAVIAALCLTGCGNNSRQSTVVVLGIGTVLAQPDTVQMSISLSKTAATTRDAQQEAGSAVRQALEILHGAGVEEKNISTASLRFYPEYDWSGQGRVLLGQKAEQVITFSIDSSGERASNIIDRLIQIDGFELHQMQFSMKDNTALYARSRELAYQKALEKAQQYAALSGLKIVRTLSIAEEGLTPVSPVFNRAVNNQMMAFADTEAASGSTALPAGEIEISSRILVEFLLK
jgi:uncharacterized protein YggE